MKSILVVGAHPDDETMLAGGTLALLSQQGMAVHLVCATRGEGGELGDPAVALRERIGPAREAEVRCAAEALGAASIRFLGYVDPVIGPDDELFAFEADPAALAGQIRAAMRDTDADVVITHGRDGEYGHPAHRLIHEMVMRAAAHSAHPPLVYSFAAAVPGIEDHLWNDSDPAHLALDVRPWLDAKEAAAMCHVSQHALFLRNHPGESIREALRKTESFHRHLPPVEGGAPHDPFADLLRAAGAWAPGVG